MNHGDPAGPFGLCEIFGMTAVVMLLLGLVQHGRLGAAFFRDSERTGRGIPGWRSAGGGVVLPGGMK